ncbi:dihydrolipoamide acetyltransferase family protein [Albimonas pacifica]|uniref:Dihydrolipoamide acetyltransferase component of pyruvate dehydrogenase complex n=1 Tax=Albimonas pacifica TaxID=1114924 RepID=A0A1I3NBJ5_9RHOB|nr:dihydrolipoamide acetyltransferase family protein [Albimonas pacifica]SFJ06612.1 branched-chain alpha-keto acid dehydrogenase E2 component [Albimonas pacifica]
MTLRTIRMPDIGEGIAEAELSAWLVKQGELVAEDQLLAEVTTDKATVEIPSPVAGRIAWLGGAPGDVLAVGADLVRIETDPNAELSDDAPAEPAPEAEPKPAEGPAPKPDPEPAAEKAAAKPAPPPRKPAPAAGGAPARGATGKPLAAPSVRGRAREAGVDLRQVRGSGPAGRILHEDLDAFISHGPAAPAPGGLAPRPEVEEVRVVGVRRRIAERMALAKSRIPHFSIVEEVDVEALETLREALNRRHAATRGKLTLLPFLLRALARAIQDHPGVNARYDDEAGVVSRHAALHAGIATQTDQGLMVPVLRHAEAQGLWQLARAIRRLSEAAREKRAAPEDLSGSTLTVTSLGPLGAIATTPIVNHPEVAIVGVNRIAVRPAWDGSGFVPRRMMNLSCSFDHRVVDGWAAAAFVADLKALLETPAEIFIDADAGDAP